MLSLKRSVKNIKPILNTKILYQNNTQKSNQNKKLKEQHNHLQWITQILSDYCCIIFIIVLIILLVSAMIDYVLHRHFNIYFLGWISTNITLVVKTQNK